MRCEGTDGHLRDCCNFIDSRRYHQSIRTVRANQRRQFHAARMELVTCASGDRTYTRY